MMSVFPRASASQPPTLREQRRSVGGLLGLRDSVRDSLSSDADDASASHRSVAVDAGLLSAPARLEERRASS